MQQLGETALEFGIDALLFPGWRNKKRFQAFT